MNRLIAALLIGFSLGLSAGRSPAAEPTTTPQLRIDPGMHTAAIRSIATDAAGRYVVTASEDKTARVWSRGGDLLLTLRPSAGAGEEGKLFAVSISPDGRTVAVAGRTGYEWDKMVSLHLFDRASGHLLRRFTGLSSVVTSLNFAPDGQALAVGLGDKYGIRVFDPATGTLLGSDPAFGGTVYGLAWHAGEGGLRLAVASEDGKLRLYTLSGLSPAGGNRTLTRQAEQVAPGGSQPSGIAFSPDGRQLAVGYDDSPAVSVVDGQTLAPRFAADTAGVEIGSLSSVAWSADGQTLWAAGDFRRRIDGKWQNFLRRWSQGGRGPAQGGAITDDTVLSLAALPDGGLLFGAHDPAWGEVDAQGHRVRFRGAPVRDYRGHRSGPMQVSADSQQLKIGGLSFALAGRQLGAPFTAILHQARQRGGGLNVTNWEDKTDPRLNGQPLKLKQRELARSVALAADGQSFALGSSWYLRRFDAQGREVWQQQVPGVVWAVNLSEGDQTLVAAYGDGTIRWHRYSDGQELLALFAHPDNKRWVLWTPSGYYDASPGAEDLIGFHVNRGKDSAADYFPAARFRSTLYRPDVLDRLLSTQNEAEAVRLANAEAGRKASAVVSLAELGNKLPPVLTLLSPDSGSSVSSATVTVKLQARSASDAPVTALRVRVNGQPVEIDGQRALKPTGSASDAVQTLVVPVPAADSEVTVFAENRHGTSTAASLRLAWAGKAPAAGETEFVAKPKLYVLAVGVSNYKQADLKLRFAAKDAQDFVGAVQNQKGSLYRDVVVKLLIDDKATRDDVLDGLEWIRREVTQRDVGMVFLAGHGFNDADGVFYYLPVEGDPDRIKRTGVVYNEIKNTLTNLAGKSIFFVDACHSGNVMGDGVRRRGQADMNFIVNELSSAENGVLVFASSTGRQFSLENTAWNNGAFTKALVEGLNGSADYNKNGRITHKMLDLYVSERVKELTKGQQTPKTLVPQGVTDYPVAVVK